MEVGDITKAATIKSFLDLSCKNTQLLFFVTLVFNIFKRQTVTNVFWGLHKIMNCAFPLIKLKYTNYCPGWQILLLVALFNFLAILIFSLLKFIYSIFQQIKLRQRKLELIQSTTWTTSLCT